MNIKGPVLILVCFFLAHICKSQEYVRIKMHNSSLIKGYVLNSIDSGGVNLSMNGYDIKVPFTQIRKISFPKSNKLSTRSEFEQNYSYPQFEKGLYHSFGVGMLAGGDLTAANLSLVNGYKVSKYFHGGLGVNFQIYEDFSTLPLYLEAKGFLKQGKFVPYYYGDLGYGFLIKHPNESNFTAYEANGGIYWGAGVGFQVNYFESAMAFGIGYNYQRIDESYSYADWWGSDADIDKKNMFRRFEIKFSLIF